METRRAKSIDDVSGGSGDGGGGGSSGGDISVFVKSVLAVVEKRFGLSDDEMDDLKEEFAREYRGRIGG